MVSPYPFCGFTPTFSAKIIFSPNFLRLSPYFLKFSPNLNEILLAEYCI